MADTTTRGEYGGANPWIIAVLVAVATFMEVLDTTIANVALRYMAGSLSAAETDSEWVMTSYLAANAVVLPMSGWLMMWLGRKRDDLCRTCHPECEVSSTVAEDAVRLMSGASGRDSGQ